MIYEFIATVAAGFGMAGLALVIRHLSKLLFRKQTPKWLTPVFVAIGIFGFQVHQEYFWYQQQTQQLPEGVQVVRAIETTSWFRPWTYLKPQVVRFMAVDLAHKQTHTSQPQLHVVDLYLFERRMSTQRMRQIIDCTQSIRADLPASSDGSASPLPELSQLSALAWHPLDADDPLLQRVCRA